MATTMKSFHLPSRFGPPSTYSLGLLPKPTVTSPDHVLTKVYAASLNPIDMRYAEGTMKYMLPTAGFPSKLGYDCSGVIEEVGPDAARQGWKSGDEVFIKLPHDDRGALSEYVLTSAKYIGEKPKNISHVEAASLPTVALTAYQVFSMLDGGLEGLDGKKVLVTAAMGGVGSIGVQVAKAFGASEVISTVSTSKIDRANDILDGVVDRLIDYRTMDIVKEIQHSSLDFVFDTAGNNVALLFPLLKPGHQCVSIAALPSGTDLQKGLPSTPWYIARPLDLVAKFRTEGPARKAGINYSYFTGYASGSELNKVATLVEKGKIKPIIGDVFRFREEDCRKACELVQGTGSTNGGKVVIKIVD